MPGTSHAAAGHTDVVAVVLPPPEAAEAIISCWDAGVAVAPADPRAPGAELRRFLEELRPTHVHDRDGRHRMLDGLPTSEAVAAVVATSGTTGRPKGVELTWAGLKASSAAVSEAVAAGPGSRWLCCVPLHAVAGLAIVARTWDRQLGLVVHPRFDPDAVMAAADQGGPLHVSLVATMLWRLLERGARLDRFAHVLLGGGPVPAGLLRRVEAAGRQAGDAGTHLSTTYGMSETWGGVVHDGHPLTGVAFRLGQGDEIELHTPTAMLGYRRHPADTGSAFTSDGWLRTGDVGAIGADGCLAVIDRRSDMVITGGVNVAPSEVEEVLRAHPGVADVCVVGYPDPEWSQRVVAFAVPEEPDRPPPLDSLRGFARSQLSAAKLPRQLVLVDAIPRTPGGKPRRKALRSSLAGTIDP